MRQYAARQRKSDELYEYTARNRTGLILPVGYCADAQRDGEPCKHETAQEAQEHYKQYLLDKETIEREYVGAAYECNHPDCKALSTRGIQVGAHSSFPLCDEHRNRETLELIVTVGESWES